MKPISPELAAHIAQEVTTLATCWKLTRRDATVMGFTDHDRNIPFESVTYAAASGFTPSAVGSTASLAVDNLEVEGMLSAGFITEADIMAGKYDFAEIEIFMVNYADLTQGALKLRRGWLGEVSLSRAHFVAEVRGLTQRLSQNIGELYSPSCRATLGDARCKVNLAPHKVSSTVTAASNRQEFTATGVTGASGIYALGQASFTSGANSGLSMEIKEHTYNVTTGARITLALPMPYAIAPGDDFNIVKGCDKTLGTCETRFANVVNFRGEPHVPGLDRMLETAGTRSVW
jgi:uncharacterized phage protein (TIGR02218 family)